MASDRKVDKFEMVWAKIRTHKKWSKLIKKRKAGLVHIGMWLNPHIK